jgi:hypothetical protein
MVRRAIYGPSGIDLGQELKDYELYLTGIENIVVIAR